MALGERTKIAGGILGRIWQLSQVSHACGRSRLQDLAILKAQHIKITTISLTSVLSSINDMHIYYPCL